MNDIIIHKDIMVAMRDGIRLATDVYLPAPSEDAMPTLLARTPYDKDGIVSGLERLDVIRAARAGYAVVVQDVRGRAASEGDFDPHVRESADGVDTIEWVTQQQWSNGLVGMFGGSYLAGTQLLASRAAPTALKVIAPWVAFADMYEGMSHQGGAEVLHPLVWAISIAEAAIGRLTAQGAAIEIDPSETDEAAILARLPLSHQPFIERWAPFYPEWLAHSEPGSFWDAGSPAAGYGDMTTPGLHVTGWYDILLESTIRNYTGLRDGAATNAARENQRLIIGPWSHTNFSGSFPEREFGRSAILDFTDIQLRWFDTWLKDRAEPMGDLGVMIFVMGTDEWRSGSTWPLESAIPTDYFLSGDGTTSTGTLTTDAPGASAPASDVFVYDPLNPVPTVGGQVVLAGGNAVGPRDQRAIEERDDVLVYSSDELVAGVEVIGPVRARLSVSSDVPSTDFTAKLVDVFPDGRAMILTEGIARTRFYGTGAGIAEIDIDLWSTANVFLPGHRIRLEVASSNFPRFSRNGNSGGHVPDESASDIRVATNRVHHDGVHLSRLILPVVHQ